MYLNSIYAFISEFLHNVAVTSNHVGIITLAALHDIVSTTAINAIVAGIAGDNFIAGTTSAVQIIRTGQMQFFKILAKRNGSAAVDDVIVTN